MIIIALLFTLSMAFFAYRTPRYALTLLVAILPVYGIRLSVFGIPTTALELAIWGVAVGWYAHQWKAHGAPHVRYLKRALAPANPFSPYLWPILLWLMAASASTLYSPNPVAAIGIWKAYFVEPLMVFVMVVLTFRNREERVWLLWALGGTALAMSALAWYQFFTGTLLPEPWATNRPLRVTSWYSYPNAVGLFLGPVVAMYFAWLLSKTCLRRFTMMQAIRFPVFVLGFWAIVFAVSKGALVGVIAGCFVSAFFNFRRQWKIVAAVGVGLAVVVLVVTPLRTRLLDEFLLQSPSGAIRKVVWQETVALLKDQPLAGAGLAGYQMALEPYHNPWHKEVSPYALEIFLYPHNVVLNTWVEVGLGGLLAFVWLLVAFFREVWRRRETFFAPIAAAGMVALLVHGLVDVPYFKNDLAVLFWIIMALPLLESPLISRRSS